ncbi:MAG: DUF4215 domain-containing protein [Deltaproteobacteria bacterium]|nr:DUF4215 domain-containing protein [Deltaproteobacteria bacterium]MBN2671071.1 DUF4215 domain-containing protein [Deltaproteobacteria bacterium]
MFAGIKDTNRFSLWLLVLLSVLVVSVVSCEKDLAVGDRGGDGDSDGDGDGDSDEGDTDTRPPTPGCGDGELTKDEACDDGNQESGDGCLFNCRGVEDGYSCNPPGEPCHLVARCGDGRMSHPELCDDGNTTDGDGCSISCKVEIGFKCTEASPSVCTPTICGDNKVEGAESCDDGNDIPFDGCSSLCQKEPDCSAGACVSECGDGLVLGEECDDGNKVNGDGCNENCEIEPGFECPQLGCMDEENCTLTVAAVFRDFSVSHPDFGSPGCDAVVTGMVEDTLTNGKPVYKTGCSVTGFSEWYTDPVDRVGSITLYPDGNGNFVNRFGANGEPWVSYSNDQWCAEASGSCDDENCVTMCGTDKVCVNVQTIRPGDSQGYWVCATENYYDGNPLFFPVDDLLSEKDVCNETTAPANSPDIYTGDSRCAKVPAQYGYDAWPYEHVVFGETDTHNFYFTSEVTYWFKYDPATPATLNFLGDDDVWVFVNGHLAVDLGGIHIPTEGSVIISAGNNFGMEAGNVYKINIFHAERKVEGSSFKLTLGGFNTARSECRPECGDGIVGLGEECDDAVNDGGYGECGPDCRLGEFCGDGILQEEYEDCDVLLDNLCPNSCRQIVAE